MFPSIQWRSRAAASLLWLLKRVLCGRAPAVNLLTFAHTWRLRAEARTGMAVLDVPELPGALNKPATLLFLAGETPALSGGLVRLVPTRWLVR